MTTLSKTNHGKKLMAEKSVLAHKTRPISPLRWHLNGLNSKACTNALSRSIPHKLIRHQRGIQGKHTSMLRGLK